MLSCADTALYNTACFACRVPSQCSFDLGRDSSVSHQELWTMQGMYIYTYLCVCVVHHTVHMPQMIHDIFLCAHDSCACVHVGRWEEILTEQCTCQLELYRIRYVVGWRKVRLKIRKYSPLASWWRGGGVLQMHEHECCVNWTRMST